MLHFVIGKPRSGKSYYVMNNRKGGAAVIRELLNPNGRYIVTNLPLVMHELEDYCARKGRRIDMAKRVTLLEHSQVRQFWRFRGGDYVREVPDDDTGEKQELQLLQNTEIFERTKDPMHLRGVLYILDEVHVYYPARGCTAKTGNWVFQYATQHGHFTDTIVMITQSLSYVEKQFREMTQDYTYMENERLRSVRGFRKGSALVGRIFIFPPTLGSEEPDSVDPLELDTEGIGKCYDTSGGAGIVGGGSADKGAKAKGLPLRAVWFIAIAGFAFFIAALLWGRALMHGWIDKKFGKPVAVATGGASRSVSQKTERENPVTPQKTVLQDDNSPPKRVGQDDPPAVSQAVTWTHIVRRAAKVYVYLTDGRVIASPSLIQYDGAGLVDLVDLEGKHWRVSRAPMVWGGSSSGTKPAELAK